MSFFSKVFGGKKEDKSMTTGEAIQNLRSTEEMLLKKQEHLETKISQEIDIAKKHGTKNKRAAIAALKRKKRYENQLAQLDGTLSTIEQQREALEGANTNTAVLTNMKDAAGALARANKDLDVDKVHDMMDQIAEQQDVAKEIADAISQPAAWGPEIDEDELEKELEELEQEELDRELLDLGPTADVDLPEPPKTEIAKVPAAPSKAKAKKEEDDDEILREMQSWAS